MHQEVFARLREIPVPYQARLSVSCDEPASFELGIPPTPDDERGVFVAAVRDGKAYASFHLMPVYVFPDLLESVSSELRHRMQGKSCFNFSRVDEGLFTELEALTARGIERFRDLGAAARGTRGPRSSG